MNNEHDEKEFRKTILFTIASKKPKKHIGINFTKEGKDLYNENNKSLKKEIKKDRRMGVHGAAGLMSLK
jgi:hypothetical protein